MEQLILDWEDQLQSDHTNQELKIYFCKIIIERPDIESFGRVNLLLKKHRLDLFKELNDFIVEYASITVLQEALCAHKPKGVFIN